MSKTEIKSALLQEQILGEFRLLFRGDKVLFLQAYLDETGTHADSPVVGVGGMILDCDSWVCLSREWQKALDDEEIESMHATDLYTNGGIFRKKEWTKDKREAFINRLYEIIINTHPLVIGHAVKVADFDRAMEEVGQFTLTPYQFLVLEIFFKISEIARDDPAIDRISVILEKGQKRNSIIMHYLVLRSISSLIIMLPEVYRCMSMQTV